MFGFREDEDTKNRKVIFESILYSVFGVLFILFLLALVLYANRVAIFASLSEDYTKENDERMKGEEEFSGQPFSEESRVVSVVDNAIPSVVSVVASTEVPIYERSGLFGGLTQEGTRERQIGGGSGFFVSEDGLIATNKHVVSSEDADYNVVTNTGRQYDVQVVARDPFIDIAFLQVQDAGGENFTPLDLSAEQPELGQKAIAIGNALGEFQNTVSVGVVSGLSRSIFARGRMGVERLEQVIQTDAALNTGNSGGPLIGLSGDVVGVNVAVAQGTENIAFAIPGTFVKSLAESVRETGEIERPFVGIRYIPLASLENTGDLPVDSGILIEEGSEGAGAIVEDSPAEEAGLQAGDIVTSVDGKDIDRENSFGFLVRQRSIGETITLEVIRNGDRQAIEVTLGEAPEDIN
jgi:S1-C subfamily serine protease